ncbi:MAG: hypothetical protein P4L53_07930 [Candidatus Obscuribacterales bacterium]|nr:hypothetical protein [Candidatus Obscuribacterales bacterium]
MKRNSHFSNTHALPTSVAVALVVAATNLAEMAMAQGTDSVNLPLRGADNSKSSVSTQASPAANGEPNAPGTAVPAHIDSQVKTQIDASKKATAAEEALTPDSTQATVINGQASTIAHPEQNVNGPSTINPFDYAHIPHDRSKTIPDSLKVPLKTTPEETKAKELERNNSLVTANAKLMPKSPLMRTRDANLRFVQVTVKNDSPEVALIHGDIAQANIAGALKTASSARYVGEVASPKLGLSGRIATGVVTAGSLGFAGPIFYENMTPDQHRKRYLGTAVGVDGSRHEIEADRFGLRVLLPGDETVGWLAFDCPNDNQMTNLVIPVNYSKSTLPSGSLVIPVSRMAPSAPTNLTQPPAKP